MSAYGPRNLGDRGISGGGFLGVSSLPENVSMDSFGRPLGHLSDSYPDNSLEDRLPLSIGMPEGVRLGHCIRYGEQQVLGTHLADCFSLSEDCTCGFPPLCSGSRPVTRDLPERHISTRSGGTG